MAPSGFNTRGSFVVAVEGLADIDFSEVPDKIKKFASMAVNTTARRYRTASSRAIREQVAFPAQYLDSRTKGHLNVSRFAKPSLLEAAITARQRPTSLTRFVKGSRDAGRKKPTVEVSPGNRQKLNRAFIMQLRSGNVGLAVRLGKNERLENKRQVVAMNNGLYLLYGPSVDQVFRSVSREISGDAGDFLETEFARLTEGKL